MIRWSRRPDGDWRLDCGSGEVAIDDLAVGAVAARHLAALGARDLRYAGPEAEGLRLRGFAIAAGALGCSCSRLESAPTGGVMCGVFADGAAAESAALAQLAATGLSVPRDVLLLGIDDGRLPTPRVPGLSRLRLDPERIADAALALVASGSPSAAAGRGGDAGQLG